MDNILQSYFEDSLEVFKIETKRQLKSQGLRDSDWCGLLSARGSNFLWARERREGGMKTRRARAVGVKLAEGRHRRRPLRES